MGTWSRALSKDGAGAADTNQEQETVGRGWVGRGTSGGGVPYVPLMARALATRSWKP